MATSVAQRLLEQGDPSRAAAFVDDARAACERSRELLEQDRGVVSEEECSAADDST